MRKPLIESDDMKLMQVNLYFKNLPKDKQDDALMQMRAPFTNYGQNTADVVKLTRKQDRRKTS